MIAANVTICKQINNRNPLTKLKFESFFSFQCKIVKKKPLLAFQRKMPYLCSSKENDYKHLKMKVRTTLLLCLILLLCGTWRMSAQTAPPANGTDGNDSIRISLLTCAAGSEIYTLFGHTAIRYENPARGIDAVFNYGMFSFNTPYFVLRFALGETDYQLGVTAFDRFAAEYRYFGRDVRQQRLNLTAGEKERLVRLLEENYRPENRTYRYNFFYDNCATRPRDRIEQAVDGTLLYADDMETRETGITYRHLLHQYSEGHPWSRFGMDLCMGSQADRPISRRQMMFVPFYLEEFFSRAGIRNEAGEVRPLVAAEEVVVATGLTAEDHRWGGVTPMQAALLLLAVVTAATLYGIRRGKSLWCLDLILFFAAGVAGCILAFLALCSQHPAVSPNYLLLVFHPLHLLCLPCLLLRVRKRKISRYLTANLIVLTLFIVFWTAFPQEFPLAVLPLALCLLIRSVSNRLIRMKDEGRGIP